VERDQKTKNVDPMLEEVLDKEKEDSEKLLWKHVLADQNSPKDAKQNLENQKDVPEDTTDVQEDV